MAMYHRSYGYTPVAYKTPVKGSGLTIMLLAFLTALFLIGLVLSGVGNTTIGESVIKSFVALCVGSGILLLLLRGGYGYLSPPVLLTAIWTVCMPVGLLELWRNVGNQTEPWTIGTWFSFLGAWSAFVITSTMCLNKTRAADIDFINAELKSSVDSRRLLTCIYIFFGLGMLAFLMFARNFASTQGVFVPLMHEDPGSVRGQFRLPIWGYLARLFIPAIVLSGLYLTLFGNVRRHWPLVAIIFLAIGLMASTGVRSDSTEAMLIAGLVITMIKRLNWRLWGSILGVIVLIFGVVSWSRVTGLTNRSLLANRPTNITYINNTTLATTYIYIGAQYNNYQSLVDSNPPLMMGIRMFRSFLGWMGQRDITSIDTTQMRFDISNTTTWVGDYYLDFGYVGVIGIPLFLGAVAAYVYRRLATKPTLFILLFYGSMAYAIILTFTTERFFEDTTLTDSVVYFAVSVWVTRSRRSHDRSQGIGRSRVTRWQALPAHGDAIPTKELA